MTAVAEDRRFGASPFARPFQVFGCTITSSRHQAGHIRRLREQSMDHEDKDRSSLWSFDGQVKSQDDERQDLGRLWPMSLPRQTAAGDAASAQPRHVALPRLVTGARSEQAPSLSTLGGPLWQPASLPSTSQPAQPKPPIVILPGSRHEPAAMGTPAHSPVVGQQRAPPSASVPPASPSVSERPKRARTQRRASTPSDFVEDLESMSDDEEDEDEDDPSPRRGGSKRDKDEEFTLQGSKDWSDASQPTVRKSTRGRKRRTEPIETQMEDGSKVLLSPKDYRSHRRRITNRESARRMRKKRHEERVTSQQEVKALIGDNEALRSEVKSMQEDNTVLQEENERLRKELQHARLQQHGQHATLDPMLMDQLLHMQPRPQAQEAGPGQARSMDLTATAAPLPGRRRQGLGSTLRSADASSSLMLSPHAYDLAHLAAAAGLPRAANLGRHRGSAPSAIPSRGSVPMASDWLTHAAQSSHSGSQPSSAVTTTQLVGAQLVEASTPFTGAMPAPLGFSDMPSASLALPAEHDVAMTLPDSDIPALSGLPLSGLHSLNFMDMGPFGGNP